jgi:aminoglycoside phosphotransferase (APT) family kinase protein
VDAGPAHDLLREIGSSFAIPGQFRAGGRHGSGHIHDTFVVAYEESGRRRRYVHQRLNSGVFRDPEQLMQNLLRVTQHLRERLEALGHADAERRTLRLVPTRAGRPFHVDAEGRYWRTLHYVEGTRSVDSIESAAQAYEVARAFGAFAGLLDDLGPPALAEPIPHFHDLGRRVEALERAAADDPHGRARGVAAELENARRQHADAQLALDDLGPLPRRVVHNDCKVNNLLLDEATGEGLCVIDLDTVMEGTLLCDFGELVRTGACPASEDERDLTRIGFDLERFAALARGYRQGLGARVGAAELRGLPFAGPTLALENAVRFLTDHLEGDVYFRIRREGHNLDRARAQLQLATRMSQRLDAARDAVGDGSAATRDP